MLFRELLYCHSDCKILKKLRKMKLNQINFHINIVILNVTVSSGIHSDGINYFQVSQLLKPHTCYAGFSGTEYRGTVGKASHKMSIITIFGHNHF